MVSCKSEKCWTNKVTGLEDSGAGAFLSTSGSYLPVNTVSFVQN